ncbi:LytR/AlgR family response regulator transcription factor [Acetanaerobacterium elongatum]|uniref:Stage 0 sporulation protein A homolog n=1 Tax=Acetanaerobacterium elongatum TaxID=258515 RepID=A0A1H0AJX4_9FIRM|nr:LytTR family DNA-binding domain-containing protein [Acetanaerobacterium elongatum]SDN33868.1 two component transcriptional regulator, LytTR family [Acetanaerobacterium elongatum]
MRVFCCDDNEIHLSQLIELLNESSVDQPLEIQGFTTSQELLAAVNENCDIILCDILLGDNNGIVTMKNVQDRFPNIKIIFVSAYSYYCEDVYDVDHVAFLHKPISQVKLRAALTRAINDILDEQGQYITVKSKSITATVPMSKILYIETVGKQLNVVTEDKFYLVSQKNGILTKLDSRFIDCGKGCVVNMSRIRTLGRQTITLFDGKEVAVAADRIPAVKQAFLHYLGPQL